MKAEKNKEAEPTSTPEQLEEAERQKCMIEVNQVLHKYGFAMVPYNNPTWKFVKVNLEENGGDEESTEDQGTGDEGKADES